MLISEAERSGEKRREKPFSLLSNNVFFKDFYSEKTNHEKTQ